LGVGGVIVRVWGMRSFAGGSVHINLHILFLFIGGIKKLEEKIRTPCSCFFLFFEPSVRFQKWISSSGDSKTSSYLVCSLHML